MLLPNLSKNTKEAKIIAEDKLTSTDEELANLKKVVAILDGELQNKEKVNSDLVTKLEEVKKLIVVNHWEGFKKA